MGLMKRKMEQLCGLAFEMYGPNVNILFIVTEDGADESEYELAEQYVTELQNMTNSHTKYAAFQPFGDKQPARSMREEYESD